LFILALAKTVTPGGSAPRERGQRAGFCPAALAAKPADKAPTGFGVLIWLISAQKPAAPMTYTDLLCGRALFDF
jgi:hypothetical protein